MKTEKGSWPRYMVRLPPDLKRWIALQAVYNSSSQNSEIIRCIRERMEREPQPGTQA